MRLSVIQVVLITIKTREFFSELIVRDEGGILQVI